MMHCPASWHRTSDRHLAADLGRVVPSWCGTTRARVPALGRHSCLAPSGRGS